MPVDKGQNITESLFPLGLAIVLSLSLMISQGTPLKRVFSGFSGDSPLAIEASTNTLFQADKPALSLASTEPTVRKATRTKLPVKPLPTGKKVNLQPIRTPLTERP